MKKAIRQFGTVLGMMGAFMLGAGTAVVQPVHAAAIESGNIPPGVGVIRAIELIRKEQSSGIAGTGIGLGAVAGAVVGGVVGNQIGSGSGRTAATVAGAAGGGYVGHQLEKSGQQPASSGVYQFTIRMNNGEMHTLRHKGTAGYRVGDRVRIRNGMMERY